MDNLQLKSLYRVSEIKLRYNYKIPYKDRVVIHSSSIAYEVLKNVWDRNKIEMQEQFKILLLDTRDSCLGAVNIGSGSLNGCMADARLVFSAALKAKSNRIILAHNHPTGNLIPSENDEALTKRFIQGGKILDISILDHLILSPDDYFSFADNGLMAKYKSEENERQRGQICPR